MNALIKQENKEDYARTEAVIKQAFAYMVFSDKKEHELVARLRNSDEFIPELSLVATEGETMIGHILLTKVKIINDDQITESLALAPVSVHPEFQNKGIGKRLINESLKKAKEMGYQSVIVLGHPEYYPKFGFKKASSWGIKSPFEVSDELFMAMELTENALADVSGMVQYSKAFFE